MNIINAPRQNGKTMYLLKNAHETGAAILVSNENRKRILKILQILMDMIM